MRIITLLPQKAYRQIVAGVRWRAEVLDAGASNAFRSILQSEPSSVAILDPALIDAKLFESMVPLLSRRSEGCLLYIRSDAESCRRTLLAARYGLSEIMLQDVDDRQQVLARRLSSLRYGSVPALVFQRLAPSIGRLPVTLRVRVVFLFAEGLIPHDVGDFLAVLSENRRSIDRWVKRAGFTGTSKLLIAARLTRIWLALTETRTPLAQVAARVGYRSVRTFQAQFSQMIDLSPRRAAETLDSLAFASRIAERILLSGGSRRASDQQSTASTGFPRTTDAPALQVLPAPAALANPP